MLLIMSRLFLLSPAQCGGPRARMLSADGARSPLARSLASPPGVALGEVMSFLSALYFRGKLTYARAFGDPALPSRGALVITPCLGLVPADTAITREHLTQLGGVDLARPDRRYLDPLERDLATLLQMLSPSTTIVLLGSISTDKYVAPLVRAFGDRLLFPGDFVGRGDMSRGGLLLRSARAGTELAYTPVVGAERRGPRPPRLPPLRRPPPP
jgi:hypothetical protein